MKDEPRGHTLMAGGCGRFVEGVPALHMPIYFSCQKCGKAMFAQEQYAGRTVLCPACQTRNAIPAAPPAPAQPQPGEGKAPSPAARPDGLIDMEVSALNQPDVPNARPVPATSAPSTPTTPALDAAVPAGTEAGPTSQAGAAAAAAGVDLADGAPGQDDRTRKCPACAETIRAEAKMCRYCRVILDEDLRKEAERLQREQIAQRVLQLASRTANTWRALAVVAVGFSAGLLLVLTLKVWNEAVWALPFFNALLMIGMLWSAIQMKAGPHGVFVTAAWAMLLCLPINLLLGLPLDVAMGWPSFAAIAEKVQDLNPDSYLRDPDQLKRTVSAAALLIGMLVSLPVWIAASKVAALQRLRAALGAGANR